jgi:ribosomal protein S10
LSPVKKNKNRRNVKFPKIRMENQISNWRKELSILAEIGTVSDNGKLNRKKRKIFQKYSMTNAKEVGQLTETLKQKVQTRAQRIRRYKKRGTQFSQNKMFKEDTKKFCRNLGMKNIEARGPFSMAEAETYWKSLWAEEAQHNERAEWIRMEQKRKISLMDWRPIQISEIALYLLKAHNWKSPGSDQIQNYWLKAFPANHRHITKNFNAIIEEPEKAPDWLTTRVTYLIPK